MKNLFYIFSLISIIALPSNAQTVTEKQNIIKNYNIDAIDQLKEELEINFLIREARISEYLQNNNFSNRNIRVKGKTYHIHDIEKGQPIYRTTNNDNSAKATKTNRLQSGGSLGLNLDGTNMNIAVWDEESVRGTHAEFKDDQDIPLSRIVYPEFPNGFSGPMSDHATHVAGTLIAKGVDSKAKGMAPKATLISYDWGLDDIEALKEAKNGLLISNHSYGVPILNSNSHQQVSSENIGAYTTDARLWDEISYLSPYYLSVHSAGNDGNTIYSGGLGARYDKLTGSKTAKNILVVANANPSLYPNSDNLINFPINTSSSQGPTDDFRIKPDITGDGSNVYSPTSTSNTAYNTFSGSSMASPNVAGTLLLLQEFYNQINSNYMKAATLKGLVCHTATDDSRRGPDPIFGWGLLNAEASILVIQGNSKGTSSIKELTLNNNSTYTYNFFASPTNPVSATISWTDPAGSVSTSFNNVITPRLVNDLDLRIEDSNGVIFFPWKLNTTDVAGLAIKDDNSIDNIERIDIPITTNSGNYTLTVTHKNVLTNGFQDFSLILTGSELTLNVMQNSIESLNVWPNPSDRIFNFSFKSTDFRTKIILYDMLGKKIYEKVLNTNDSLIQDSVNTENFFKGIYFLNIQNGTKIYNKKIIIK